MRSAAFLAVIIGTAASSVVACGSDSETDDGSGGASSGGGSAGSGAAGGVAADAGHCCPPALAPSCCLKPGGWVPENICPTICDGIDISQSTLTTDSHGCEIWTYSYCVGGPTCCGAAPIDAGADGP